MAAVAAAAQCRSWRPRREGPVCRPPAQRQEHRWSRQRHAGGRHPNLTGGTLCGAGRQPTPIRGGESGSWRASGRPSRNTGAPAGGGAATHRIGRQLELERPPRRGTAPDEITRFIQANRLEAGGIAETELRRVPWRIAQVVIGAIGGNSYKISGEARNKTGIVLSRIRDAKDASAGTTRSA